MTVPRDSVTQTYDALTGRMSKTSDVYSLIAARLSREDPEGSCIRLMYGGVETPLQARHAMSIRMTASAQA